MAVTLRLAVRELRLLKIDPPAVADSYRRVERKAQGPQPSLVPGIWVPSVRERL